MEAISIPHPRNVVANEADDAVLHQRVAAAMADVLGSVLPPPGSKAHHEFSLKLSRLINTILPTRDALFTPELREALQMCWAESEDDAGGFSRGWRLEVAIKGRMGVDIETDYELLCRLVDTSSIGTVLHSRHATDDQKEQFLQFLASERGVEIAREMVLSGEIACDQAAAAEFFFGAGDALLERGLLDPFEFAVEAQEAELQRLSERCR